MTDYDYIIIGSGFGGSVSALRLSEKGYRVLVVEKGRWYEKTDFPKTNWNLRKWLWIPAIRFFGILKLTIFKHVSILSGVGVGGGSLVYANTLPVPKSKFFQTGNWAGLANWEKELQPYYRLAYKMLGATKNPRLFDGDESLKKLAHSLGRDDSFDTPEVAVFFGRQNETVGDPYFDGKGPDRTGCTFCGSCMTGCRVGAKNTLDKNYLHLAMGLGAEVMAEQEVEDVAPIQEPMSASGYEITIRESTRFRRKRRKLTAGGIIFSGGVLGTVPLLLKLKSTTLPNLSDRVGMDIRVNNETLISVVSPKNEKDYSRGVAIGSILHTDESSHLEVVRYGKGSGFWKLLHVPYITGQGFVRRFFKVLSTYFSAPLDWIRTYWKGDWSTKTNILLFMQSMDSTLSFLMSRFGRVNTRLTEGKAPAADIPESENLTKQFAEITGGRPVAFIEQTLLGKISTAHILGGAVMGGTKEAGVIDKNNHVFGYKNMYVIDGAMISANPGVNPSLTITALAERAMSLIPDK